MRKTVFLDRDGTINIEKNYLYKPEEFEFIKGVPEAIHKLNEAGYLVIVVTNQSGIARGYYSEEDLNILHEHINQELEKKNAHIDKYYYCPHHPTEGIGKYRMTCKCRKPGVGLYEDAMRDFDIDVKHSWIAGDRLRDLNAADYFGMQKALVLTGYGLGEQKIAKDVDCYTDLLEFVNDILR